MSVKIADQDPGNSYWFDRHSSPHSGSWNSRGICKNWPESRFCENNSAL